MFVADRLSILLKDNSFIDNSSINDSSTNGSATGNSTITLEEQLNKIYLTVLKNSVVKYTKQERKK